MENGLIPVLPVGTIEQHGPHLPIKMDRWTATEISKEACKRHQERLLFMPPISYGYTTHVMDFPGSITIHHETFIRYVLDVLKSVAYHGFKKIIVIIHVNYFGMFRSNYFFIYIKIKTLF